MLPIFVRASVKKARKVCNAYLVQIDDITLAAESKIASIGARHITLHSHRTHSYVCHFVTFLAAAEFIHQQFPKSTVNDQYCVNQYGSITIALSVSSHYHIVHATQQFELFENRKWISVTLDSESRLGYQKALTVRSGAIVYAICRCNKSMQCKAPCALK